MSLSVKAQQPNSDSSIVRLKWINFSPYTDGQNPNDPNNYIPESHIISLLDSLQPWVEGIRTFGTQHGLENIPYLAKQRGFKVILGIWLGKEGTPEGVMVNEQQIANGIAIANAGYVDRIIVGSEVLFRGDLSPSKLIQYIDSVKLACPNIPVSCADICSKLIANPDVVAACDFVSPNIYPFWEGISVECAMQQFDQCYQSLLPVANGKEIFISESGWKTTGPLEGDAVPSFENAIRYNRELLGWSEATGVEVNIFSAFDEPWKLPNDDGWGIFFSDATMKPGMDTLFTPFEYIDSTWLCTELNNSSTDTLYVNYIPVIGSFLDVEGHVDHLNPCDYRILTYIKVDSHWWIKPTYAEPTVPILCDGKWKVDYTTGGSDNLATDICLFVVPFDYSPPLCVGGCSIFPAQVYQNAVASNCIHRYVLTSATLSASDDTICKGDTTTLIASGGATYLWDTGETTDSIKVFPEYTKSYSVTISDGLGGGKIASITVSVLTPLLYYIDTNPNSICLGDTSTLTTYPPSDEIEYLWSTGETSDSIKVSPDTWTSYTVTITNSEGCTQTGWTSVNVFSSSAWAVSDSICSGEVTTIHSYGNSAAIGYLWNTGQTTPSIHVSPATTTTYTVTVTSSDSCTSESQVTIYVSPSVSPSVSISASATSICLNQNVTFTANSVNGGTSPIFQWVVNGVPQFGSNSSTFSTSSLTNGAQVYCRMTSNAMCVNPAWAISNIITISVNSSMASVSVSATSSSICTGENVIFTANPTNGGTAPAFQWYVNGALQIADSATFSSASLANGAQVYCVMASSDVCANLATSNSIEVTVNPLPLTIISSPADGAVCLESTLSLYVTTDIDALNASFLWIGPENFSSTLQNPDIPNVKFWNQGVYSVTVTNDNTGCSKDTSTVISVDSLPSVNISGNSEICIGDSTTLIASGGIEYMWSTGDVSDSITISPFVTTEYTVAVTNAEGCSDTASVNVIVITESPPCMTGVSNGIENNQSVKVFPNPSNDNFAILLEGWTGQVRVQLLDAQGRTIFSKEDGVNEFQIQNMPRGVYWLKITNDKFYASKRLIVQ